MLIQCCGIRDILKLTGFSVGKILKTLAQSKHEILLRKNIINVWKLMNSWHWLEMKKNKHWLQYVYDRSNGEIVAFLGFKTDARDLVAIHIVVLSSNREGFPTRYGRSFRGK